MHTLMLIMTMTTLITNILLVSVYFWVIILFLGRAKTNPLFHYLQSRSEILCYGIYYQRDCLVTLVTFSYEYFFLIPPLCIVTTRVLFKLLTTQFLMNKPNTLRLISPLHIIISSMALSLYLLFLLCCNMQISLPNRILFSIFFSS